MCLCVDPIYPMGFFFFSAAALAKALQENEAKCSFRREINLSLISGIETRHPDASTRQVRGRRAGADPVIADCVKVSVWVGATGD